MKVWIVSYGHYSDKGVDMVFDSREKADAYVRSKLSPNIPLTQDIWELHQEPPARYTLVVPHEYSLDEYEVY